MGDSWQKPRVWEIAQSPQLAHVLECRWIGEIDSQEDDNEQLGAVSGDCG